MVTRIRRGEKGGTARAAAAANTATAKSKAAADADDEAREFKLFTPREVDKEALERGLLECDCHATVSAIPLLGLARARVASNAARDGEMKASSVGAALALEAESDCPLLARGGALADALPSADVPTYLELCCYLRYFLALPHPALGRPGPVCPFVPTALQKDVLYLSVVRTGRDADAGAIKTLARRFLRIFPTLSPTKGRLRQWKAVILIFPDIAAADAPRLIDAVQRDVKGAFVEQGLVSVSFYYLPLHCVCESCSQFDSIPLYIIFLHR